MKKRNYLSDIEEKNRNAFSVIADFEGLDGSEMTVKKGEVVQIVKEDGEWLFGTVGARVSLVVLLTDG